MHPVCAQHTAVLTSSKVPVRVSDGPKSSNVCCSNMCWVMQVIDPVCARHTAVLTSSKVPFNLSDGPDPPEVMIVPRHKKFEGAGKKATTKTKVCLNQHMALSLTTLQCPGAPGTQQGQEGGRASCFQPFPVCCSMFLPVCCRQVHALLGRYV